MAEAEPRVSVAIVTRDREQRLAALLESLRRQTLGTRAFEVVVVDDGSSDGTAELGLGFAAGFAWARLQGWDTRRAVVAAHCVAARALQATGDWELYPTRDELLAELSG